MSEPNNGMCLFSPFKLTEVKVPDFRDSRSARAFWTIGSVWLSPADPEGGVNWGGTSLAGAESSKVAKKRPFWRLVDFDGPFVL
jgi:hypothetical protein